jgi:hypothetical protein
VLLQVFSQSLPVCEVLVSAGVGDVSAGLGGAMHTYWAHIYVRCVSMKCSRASSPRAWAQLLTVDFGTPSYEFTINICTYLIL